MAFNLFGKRDKPTSPEPISDAEPEPAQPDAPAPPAEPARRSLFGFGQRPAADPTSTTDAEEPARRGFFDRMRQAVSRTRESLSDNLASVVALTREVDESTIADLEPMLLAADLGQQTTSLVLENLRQRAYRTGIAGGAELKDLLKAELRQILDSVARPIAHPRQPARTHHDGRRQRHR